MRIQRKFLVPVTQSVEHKTWEPEVASSTPGSTNILSGDWYYKLSLWQDYFPAFTAVHCFDDGYVGKQPLAWKEYCEG